MKIEDIERKDLYCKVINDEQTHKNSRTIEYEFLGSTASITSNKPEDHLNKRNRAIDLIPNGAIIVPKNLISLFNGVLMAGILQDSVYTVYGICEGGIRGYACSVYYVPTKEELDKMTPNQALLDSIHGEEPFNRVYNQIIPPEKKYGRSGQTFFERQESDHEDTIYWYCIHGAWGFNSDLDGNAIPELNDYRVPKTLKIEEYLTRDELDNYKDKWELKS